MNEKVTDSLLSEAKTLDVVVKLSRKNCEIDPVEAILNLSLAKSVSLGLFKKMYDKPRDYQINAMMETSAGLTGAAAAARYQFFIGENTYFTPAEGSGKVFLLLLMGFVYNAAQAGKTAADVHVTRTETRAVISIGTMEFSIPILEPTITSAQLGGEYQEERAVILQEILDELGTPITVQTGGKKYVTATYTSAGGNLIFQMEEYYSDVGLVFLADQSYWSFLDQERPNIRTASFIVDSEVLGFKPR